MGLDPINDLLIFMHIPKTGGTTLRVIIENQYKGFQVYRNYEYAGVIKGQKSEKTCFIDGHDYFGAHHDLNKRPVYITLLRNPVERIISEYYYTVRQPGHDRYISNKIKNNNMSLGDYIAYNDEKFHFRTRNMQTRFAAGGKINLENAKENLTNYFPVVGITEMFDQSLHLMRKEFGWKDTPYQNRLVQHNRPKKEHISPHIIEEIKKNNELDMELYEWAKTALQQKLN